MRDWPRERPGRRRWNECIFCIEAAAQAIAGEALADQADAAGVIAPEPVRKRPTVCGLIGMCRRAEVTAGARAAFLRVGVKIARPRCLICSRETSPAPSRNLRFLCMRAPIARHSCRSGRAEFGNRGLWARCFGQSGRGCGFAERQQIAALCDAVLDLVGRWPANRSLRIAEISDGAPRISAAIGACAGARARGLL